MVISIGSALDRNDHGSRSDKLASVVVTMFVRVVFAIVLGGVFFGCSTGSGSGSSSSSSGSSGGGTTVACKQKAGADADKDCAQLAASGQPRKLDCEPSQTDAAIAAGCVRTNPGGSDVCCPTTVSGSPVAASTTVPCRQKVGSDTDSDCAAQKDLPRKLDCDSTEQTNAAIEAGCVPTKIGDSDVCCPLTVNGTSSTSTSDAGSGGSCTTNYSGSWGLSGTCPETACAVAQSGCSLSITCGNGTTLSGTISGTSASLTGKSGAGTSLTCTVTFSGSSSFALACGVCTGSGTKK